LRKDLRESKEITNEPVEDNEIVSDNSELSHLDTSPLIETEIQFAKEPRGRFSDLFSSSERKWLTSLLWFIWFGTAFSYYGLALLTTELLTIIKEQQQKNNFSTNVLQCVESAPAPNSSNCTHLDIDDYVGLLWTNAAEFPGILLTLFIIEKIGRKKTLAAEFFLAVLFFFLMLICPINKNVLLLFIFGAKGTIVGTFQATIVYTSEVYPTSIRAVGLGTGSSLAHLGAMITPFVAEVLLRTSIAGSKGIYGAVSFLCGVCALLLPIETKGRALQESLGKT
jgi:MFS family permease